MSSLVRKERNENIDNCRSYWVNRHWTCENACGKGRSGNCIGQKGKREQDTNEFGNLPHKEKIPAPIITPVPSETDPTRDSLFSEPCFIPTFRDTDLRHSILGGQFQKNIQTTSDHSFALGILPWLPVSGPEKQ
jgi:hypothetical protein